MRNYTEISNHLLKYYYVYKYQSYKKASESNPTIITERSLRYSVKEIEDILGINLISTETGKIEFTSFGQIIGEYAVKQFDELTEMNNVINGLLCSKIRLGLSDDFYEFYAKKIIQEYNKIDPDTEFDIHLIPQDYSIYKLKNKEIDLAVAVSNGINDLNLSAQPFMKASIYLAYNSDKSNLFSNIQNLSPLTDYKGGCPGTEDPFYKILMNSLEKENINLNMVLTINDHKSLEESIKTGYIDYAFVGNYTFDKDISYTDITDLFEPIIISFVWRSLEKPTKAIDELIRFTESLGIKPIELGK